MINHIREVWQDLLIAGGIGGVGGVLYYLSQVQNGKVFTWTFLILNAAISAFAGVIAMVLLRHLAGFDYDVCAAFSGIAGWMGTNGLELMRKRIVNSIEK